MDRNEILIITILVVFFIWQLRDFIKDFHILFGKDHTHKWADVKCNQWQIATRQECKCGVYRELKAKEGDYAPFKNNFKWVYSDGTEKEYWSER